MKKLFLLIVQRALKHAGIVLSQRKEWIFNFDFPIIMVGNICCKDCSLSSLEMGKYEKGRFFNQLNITNLVRSNMRSLRGTLDGRTTNQPKVFREHKYKFKIFLVFSKRSQIFFKQVNCQERVIIICSKFDCSKPVFKLFSA